MHLCQITGVQSMFIICVLCHQLSQSLNLAVGMTEGPSERSSVGYLSSNHIEVKRVQ